MAKAVLFSYENQYSAWIKKRTFDVSETILLNKFANAEKLTNQTEEYFFNKFECFNDAGENI